MDTRFQFPDFLKVFAMALLLYAGLFALFSAVPDAAQTIETLPKAASFAIEYLLQFAVLFFPLWILVVNKYSATLADFGFLPVSWKTLLKTVLASYTLYLVLSLSILLLLSQLSWNLPGYQDQGSYLPFFGTDLAGILTGLFFVTLLAPFLEELLFRGFVYRIFIKTMPPLLGSILSALLFAFAHLQFQSIIPLFILGMILNAAYRKTSSLWTPFAFHSFNNLLAFAVDIYFSTHPATLEQVTALIYTLKL